jgi:hypothetical protein
MKRTANQQWRMSVAFAAPLNIVGAIVVDHDHRQRDLVEVANLMRRKKTACVIQRARPAECKLDGRSIDVCGFEPAGAFTRRVVLSSAPVPITKLVPTLP